MTFFYLKRKDGAIVMADFDSNEEGSWVNLSYGGEGEHPYFGSLKELSEIVQGKMNDSRSYDITKRMKEDLAEGLVEIQAVEL